MLNVTTSRKEISPFLWCLTKFLYTPSGELPVGRPSTKGLLGVGPKALIRSGRIRMREIDLQDLSRTNDIAGDEFGCRILVVTNDKTHLGCCG